VHRFAVFNGKTYFIEQRSILAVGLNAPAQIMGEKGWRMRIDRGGSYEN
jgi:hypothetical protein